VSRLSHRNHPVVQDAVRRRETLHHQKEDTDEIIFRQLETDQLRQITEMLLARTRRRLHAQDVTLEITPAAIDWLAARGFQPEYGARPLRRTIQRELDNRLSRMLLGADLAPGQTVRVDEADGHLSFEVASPAPAATA
jgi:ATP-dependent Clp protease ATP-binding subunit ClpC